VTIESVLAEVTRLAPTLHAAGTFTTRTLEALVRHATARPIHHSVETGSGASTLLLSHISHDHVVFALDGGNRSVEATAASPLLRRETVTFVDGPTQLTVPRHAFTAPLQFVLIDGPHAYPFPDLEYYHLYPHIEAGGLLVIDDIHIPTIANLFDFLSVDEMFHVEEVVENTAFFRRTAAPTFPPTGDDWVRQRYNMRVFESVVPQRVDGPSPSRTERPVPAHVDQLGPHEAPHGHSRLVVSHNDDLTIAGWAIDPGRQRPAFAVDLVLDGVAYRTELRVPRADVASAYGDTGYFRSGFNARLPKALLAPGARKLEVRVVLAGGREYHRALALTLDVT
jgi:hypothetical protein